MDPSDLASHLRLLSLADVDTEAGNEIIATPIFSASICQYGSSLPDNPYTQYGLLGCDTSLVHGNIVVKGKDPRIYHNVSAPSSVFICGSQGSGKSHTLSCLLENCLLPSEANVLPRPLTGIVFHYDTFISDTAGSPCEAAYLSSHKDIAVRVLCPPTNVVQIKRIYSSLSNVVVEELRIDEADLDTRRMLDLMAVSSSQGGSMPLYLHVVTRILRDLRVVQQSNDSSFNYKGFKQALALTELTVAQSNPLQQRLETLESFMVKRQVETAKVAWNKHKASTPSARQGNSWTPKPGQLTIVDLSCPCVTAESACALFNICLSLFLEQNTNIGRIVALDEAHKYMTDTAECETLTKSLLETIRLQRHLGTRVAISTQEPTISPKLLDLCSVTISSSAS
ncbi:hypothetical protein CDD81_1441 [Ophiocordyceps australis]|uniref:AAA+ ATPase domain-containing protein n=1 Tax=Ophiocordyceps australis TaxID=1399860 RepID=A0A2C5XTI3_9HYPO|nr:hypothetical protein CDD81_1441 [Ophiocordyceps australis]